MTKQEFARLCAEAQSAMKMTNQEYADRLLVSGPTLTRWKAGQHQPYPATRAVLVKMFREDIAGGKNG